MKRRLFLALALMPTMAFAHSYKLGNISIGHAWGLPSKDGETQIFMPLVNNDEAADSLIFASTDLTKSTELRTDGDYAKPAETSFTLDPHQPFPMRPTAKHIRLLGLSKPLLSGEQILVTLKFQFAGETKIDVHIQDKAGE